jgi:hypothetical protein
MKIPNSSINVNMINSISYYNFFFLPSIGVTLEVQASLSEIRFEKKNPCSNVAVHNSNIIDTLLVCLPTWWLYTI